MESFEKRDEDRSTPNAKEAHSHAHSGPTEADFENLRIVDASQLEEEDD